MAKRIQETGRLGEDRALAHYEHDGWTLIARNYRAGPKEVDLIVGKGRLIVFAEVKTRRTRTGGGPLDTVGLRKRRAVAEAARHWIFHYGGAGQSYRFDVVGVEIDAKGTQITHVPDAWRP